MSPVAISSDNKYIVSGGIDRTVRIWNPQKKAQEAVLQGHTHTINSVAIASDDKYIVFCGFDNTVRIWNLQDRTKNPCCEVTMLILSSV